MSFATAIISLLNISAAVASVTLALMAIALRKIENLHLIVFVLRANKGASASNEIEVLLNWAAGLGVTAALPPLLHAVPRIAKASVKSVVWLEFFLLTIVTGVLLAAVIVCGEAKPWLIFALVLMTIAIIALVALIRVKSSEFDSSLKTSETTLHVFIILTIVTSILSTIFIIQPIVGAFKSEIPAMWTMSLTLVCFLQLVFARSFVAIFLKFNKPKWFRITIRIIPTVVNCILIFVTAGMILRLLISGKRALIIWPEGWLVAVFIVTCIVAVAPVAVIILCACMNKIGCQYPVKFKYFQRTVIAAAALTIIVAILESKSVYNSAFKQSTLESNASCATNLSSTDSAVAMRSRSQALLVYGLRIPIGYRSTPVDISEMLLTRVKAKVSASLSVKTEMPRQARLEVTADVWNLFATFFARQLPIPFMRSNFQPKLTANPVTAIVNAEMMSNGSPRVEIRVKSSYLVINDLGIVRSTVTSIADFIYGLEQEVQMKVANTLERRITRGLHDVWPSPDVMVQIDRVRIDWN